MQKCIYTCPACQVSERLKIGAKWQAEFASVYTFALLAKNVIAWKHQAHQQNAIDTKIFMIEAVAIARWFNNQTKLKTE